MRVVVFLLCILACPFATGDAAARRAHAPKPAPPPLGPWPEGRLEVRIDSSEPLTHCDVLVSRDGVIVHHGPPDADGRIAVDRLPPGTYDVRAVARSWVQRGTPGRPDRPDAARRLMWMRNGLGEGHGEIREAKKNQKKPPKPEVVRVRIAWGPRVAGAVIAD
jgi:hypothetical protein